MATGAGKPLIFISYSHFDQEAKEFAQRHLGMLERLGEIEVWEDSQIVVGDDWFQVIEAKLQACSVAVLLISTDFLRSEFCMKQEVPVLLERRRREGMMIAPILLRPCAWQIVPWLAAIQMQPSGNKALLAFDTIRQEEELTQVVIAVHGFLEKHKAKDSEPRDIEVKGDTAYEKPLAIDLTRLPTSGFDVVGRDKEIQFLNEAFDDDRLNVVSLRAWGGVGKSTLVNKWCEYLAADNFRGARRVFAWSFYSQGTGDGQGGAERVTSADAFIDEALRFFQDDDPTAGSPWSKGERLAELVGKEKALLLLDGMEPLQDAHQGIKDPALARLVECLAETNAGLCVITTREPVKEFSDFPDTTQEVDLEHLSKEAGRALLRIKGLRAADDLLEQASEAFGNHALALNLLASYLQLVRSSVEDALKIPDLPDVPVDDGKHPRRVMTAFVEELGEGPELDLLHVMGLFDRPADAGCLAALRKEPAIPGLTGKLSELDENGWHNLLAKLRGFGLIADASQNAPDNLDAHPLVREHFGEDLRAKLEEAWKVGHGRLYKHLKTVPKKHQPDTLAEMAPLFQAIHHGCQAGHYCDAYDEVYWSRISRLAHYLTKSLGAYGASLGILSNFFEEHWTKTSAALDAATAAWITRQVGFDLFSLGRSNSAKQPMEMAFSSFIQQEDWGNASVSAYTFAMLHRVLGELTKALEYAEKGVEFAQRSNDKHYLMVRHTTLANVKHHMGDLENSLVLFEMAEEMQARIYNQYPLLFTLRGYEYCDLLLTLGRADEVRKRSTVTLAWVTKGNWLLDIALDNLCLGRASILLGDRNDAQVHLDLAVDGLRQAGQLDHLPCGLLARAGFFREMDQCERAKKDLDEVMRIAQRGEMRLHECDAHLEYARLALAEGNPDAALPHFESAQQLVAACGYHRRDPDIAELKGKLGL